MKLTYLIGLLVTGLFALSTQAATFIVDLGHPSYPSSGNVTNLMDVTVLSAYTLVDSAGNKGSAAVKQSGFTGVNAVGLDQSSGDFQAKAVRDSYYVTGSASGHLNFSGLQPNTAYTLTLVASRSGDDGGRGRTGLYTLESAISIDSGSLDASDNTYTLGLYGTADAAGQLNLTVQADTSTSSRYAYLNAVKLEVSGGGISNTPPVAAFTNSQVAGTLTVNFNAGASTDTDGTIVAYAWDFGNTRTGSGVTTSHTYAVAGSYPVTLTVTDDLGATHQLVRTVVVQLGGTVCAGTICDNAASGASFVGSWSGAATNAGYYGSNYLHDKNAGKGSKTVQWKYNIGLAGKYTIAAQWSQSTNRATNVQYRYTINGGAEQSCGARVSQRVNGGKFNVLCSIPALPANATLTVILRNDATGGYVIADAVRVEREVPVNTPPVAAFTYHSDLVFGNRYYTFDASLSSDDGTIVSYDWNFDGEYPETASGITSQYEPWCASIPCDFEVTLTVTDNLGATTSLTQTVRMGRYSFYEPILIDFGSPTYATANSLGANERLETVYGTGGGVSHYGVSTGGWSGVNTFGSTTASTASAPNNAWRDSIFISNREAIATVSISGLAPSADYTIEIGASRLGDDGGRGRYTKYASCSFNYTYYCEDTTDWVWKGSLDASDNTSSTVKFIARPSWEGVLLLGVAIDPDSISRYGYLGWIRITPYQPDQP